MVVPANGLYLQAKKKKKKIVEPTRIKPVHIIRYCVLGNNTKGTCVQDLEGWSVEVEARLTCGENESLVPNSRNEREG